MGTLSPLEIRAIQDFKARLAATVGDQLISLTLFGSRAHGQGNEDSDLDVAVVVRHGDWRMKQQIYDLAWECYWAHGVDISPLVLSEEEWTELKSLERRIAHDIETRGMPL